MKELLLNLLMISAIVCVMICVIKLWVTLNTIEIEFNEYRDYVSKSKEAFEEFVSEFNTFREDVKDRW